MEVSEEYLEHFGIRGMKWGQRKAQSKAAINEGRNKFNKWGKGDKKKETAKKVAVAAVIFVGARFVVRQLSNTGMRLLRRHLERAVIDEGAVWAGQAVTSGALNFSTRLLP